MSSTDPVTRPPSHSRRRSIGETGGLPQRHIGLLGAVGVGVGAIVGGGILVLAGVAFVHTGPGAAVAFAGCGLVAFLTALSYAEISTAFPESGGTYAFAVKFLGVRAAFGIGWVLWFAYIVAGVLYALGFASFASLALEGLWSALGSDPPSMLGGRNFQLFMAIGATAAYVLLLLRKSSGGGHAATVGKVVLFVLLILVGAVAIARQPLAVSGEALTPFFSGGTKGLFVAMGFTFIALQGFDLIPAIAGEIKNPRRVIPRAMFISLGVALIVYIPLLLVVATVGSPGSSISELAAAQPDTIMAVAIESYMGRFGYWIVIVAAPSLNALGAPSKPSCGVASLAFDGQRPNLAQGTRSHAPRAQDPDHGDLRHRPYPGCDPIYGPQPSRSGCGGQSNFSHFVHPGAFDDLSSSNQRRRDSVGI